jgi:parallel beta-helix repeat protein
MACNTLLVVMEQGSADAPRAIYVKGSYAYSTGDGTANRPYQTIQKAIDLAKGGDSIYVFEGTYNESLTINKRINLSGLDRKNTTIQKAGVSLRYLIDITADNVALEDLNLSDAQGSIRTAILHITSENVRLIGLRVTHGKKWGIFLDGSNDGTFGFSTIDNMSDSCVYAQNSDNNVFSTNFFCNASMAGLYLSSSDNAILFNNTIKNMNLEKDSGMGVDCEYCNRVNISTNFIRNCSLDGLHLYGGSANLVENNTVRYCDRQGIYVSSSSSTVTKNTVVNNGIGMFVGGSHNVVTSNTIQKSVGIGLYMDVGSSNNAISLNHFVLNGVNAKEMGINQWDSQGRGNYWDDYQQGDKNKDGIGDVPYTRMGGVDHFPLGEFLKPPLKPSHPSPSDAQDQVGLSITLKVNVTDPDSTMLTVYFYNASNDQLLGYEGGVKRNTTAFYSFTLPFETTYSWYAVASDGLLENRSDIWFFTTRQIPPTNKKPIADPGGPYTAKIGQMITFDGSRSFDPDGRIIFYRWNFGDGSSEILDKLPQHSYSNPGSYTVTLTVVDNDGRSAIRNTSVVISGQIYVDSPPNASFQAVSTSNVNTVVLYNASRSNDTDGTIVGYRWDFNGDGINDTGWLTSPVITHVFTSAGSYLVILEVKDNGGMVSSYSSPITIQNVVKKSPGFEIILLSIAVLACYLIYRRKQ